MATVQAEAEHHTHAGFVEGSEENAKAPSSMATAPFTATAPRVRADSM